MKKLNSSRLRLLTWAVLFAAGGFASCSDNGGDEPAPAPPVELKNQIEYDGGKLIDIKSVIFDVEDTDLYTFYLSPTAGITDIAGMSAAKDYLAVVVRNPKGQVNTATETFEITYKDISVKKQTMDDVAKVQLSADLVAETQQLNLYIEVALKSGKTLLVRYESACTEAVPQKLENQFDLDKSITDIGSVVEWLDPADGSATYYFYAQSDVTAPSEATPAALQIFFAEGVETANVDLSTADPEKVKVLCGEFENGEGATGVLNLTKTAKAAGLTVSLDARSGGSRLRIAYAGAFVSGYESDNRLKVTVADTPEEADVKRVFRHKESLTNNFAFGLADAELPADLMTGNYAVQLGLSDLNIGKTIDLATEGSKCTLALYDYATYTTYDIAKIEGVTGSVTTFGTAERLYLRLSAVFPEGPAIECEWFGDATSVEEAFDLTPVRPFVPHVTVYSKEGDVLQTYDLASAEMRMEKNFRLRGGDPAYGGATFDAYFFYFRPVGFSGDIDEQYAKYEYPLLMIPVSYLPSTELKLYEPKDDLHWNFMYVKNENTLQYASGGYSETYSMYGMTSGYCPDDAMLTVVRNEDKSWKIVYTMTDSGSKDVYGTPQPWGYGNKAVLEWEGPIVKYSGTKKNDLTDADY